MFDTNFGLMRKYMKLVENVIWQELVKCLLQLSFQKEKKKISSVTCKLHFTWSTLENLIIFKQMKSVTCLYFINYRKFFKIKLWKTHENSHFIKFHDLISFSFHVFFLDFIKFCFWQSNLVWFCLHFNN